MENVCAVNLVEMNQKERYATLLKLHRQFAHPSKKKLVLLLRDAKVWDNEFNSALDEIYKQCNVCKVFSRTPSKSVVALPMAQQFNEIVCMDLKQRGSKWILYLIDNVVTPHCVCIHQQENSQCCCRQDHETLGKLLWLDGGRIFRQRR